jgi:hypothetical protein
MKKIIDGMRYNTEISVLIGKTNNIGRGCDSVNDFQYWEAALYKTPRSGRFFLAGSGGAMSRFAQASGQNTWTGGSDLIPLTKDEAYQWAEQHLSPEQLEAAFPEKIQDA